jgi:hypothetical protein
MVDKSAVLARLREFATRTSILSADVTVEEVMGELDVKSKTTARKWMKAFADANRDEVELLRVSDGRGHRVMVLRERRG